MIPEELASRVQRQFGLQDLDPARLTFAAKTDQHRAEVWLDAVKHHPPGERNPWRKCHTENYWAYYLTLPEHKHASYPLAINAFICVVPRQLNDPSHRSN